MPQLLSVLLRSLAGALRLHFLHLFKPLGPFRLNYRLGLVFLQLRMYGLLVNKILLDDELLNDTEQVGKGIVKSQCRCRPVEYAHKHEWEYVRHVLHHGIVGILRRHIPVVQGEEQARGGH